jgi:hypothetical protein
MKPHVFGFALLSVAAIVASIPAQAQNGSLTRSFVSSAGSDTNSCMITAPCQTFAVAYTKISANGIVAALDPGKYGPLNIVGPVTINGNGWAAITATAAGSGITVDAGTGNVTLNGLEVDGAGAAYNGIVFNAGGNLSISNCVIKDFILPAVMTGITPGTVGNGIWIAPATGTIPFSVVNTTVTNNKWAGINYQPTSGNATAIGTIDHVLATNNINEGLAVDLGNAAGGSAAVSISNSVVGNNGAGIGEVASPGTVTVTIDNDEISGNIYGLIVNSGTALVSRSVITQNASNGILSNGTGTIDSFQNNQIYANGFSTTDNVSGTVSDISPR